MLWSKHFPSWHWLQKCLEKQEMSSISHVKSKWDIITGRVDQRVTAWAAVLAGSGLGRRAWDRAAEHSFLWQGIVSPAPQNWEAATSSSNRPSFCPLVCVLTVLDYKRALWPPSPFLQAPQEASPFTGAPEFTEAHYFPMCLTPLSLRLFPTWTQHL